VREWRANSQVGVAVADAPTGPFKRISTAVPVWAHNPEAIFVPGGALGMGIARADGTRAGDAWVIFTLGNGVPLQPE